MSAASSRALFRNLHREANNMMVRVFSQSALLPLFVFIYCLHTVLCTISSLGARPQDYNFRNYALRRTRLGFKVANESGQAPAVAYQVRRVRGGLKLLAATDGAGAPSWVLGP
jgi:uncharacterized membrane protein YccC